MEALKKKAAASAVGLLKSGQVVGLGTGSTANYMIAEVGKLVRAGRLKISGVPTSNATEKLARGNGIPLTTLYDHPDVDITIDGADQIDKNLNMIKGGGGAHLREKLVAMNSRKLIIIVDESKMVEKLSYPVPVEVAIPLAESAKKKLEKLGCSAKLRELKGEPYITDNGNYIIDCDFGIIENPAELENKINSVEGVFDNGIFCGFSPEVHVGTKEGVIIKYRKA